MLNQECIRDILIYIDRNQKHSASGNRIPFKFSQFCADEEMKEKYSLAEMNTAVCYLVDKKMLASADAEGKTQRIHIEKITAKGYDYLQVIQNDTVWNKLKDKLHPFFDTGITVIVEHAIKTFLPFL